MELHSRTYPEHQHLSNNLERIILNGLFMYLRHRTLIVYKVKMYKFVVILNSLCLNICLYMLL